MSSAVSEPSALFLVLSVVLLAARWLATERLARLNLQELDRWSDAPPPALAGILSPTAYSRAVAYSRAHLRLGRFEDLADALAPAALLLSGSLPWLLGLFGSSPLGGAAFIVTTFLLLSLPSLPLEWWNTFRLEARFGFNRTTAATWWSDQLKGAILGILFGGGLAWLLLVLVERIGPLWWLWGWASFVALQVLLVLLYPRLILPLFNKLTPLPDGDLRRRLVSLAGRAGFSTGRLEVIDGSRRSAHANAYFTGFGRFRRIVLYDTLIQQLSPAEIEAVLAHEIGHAHHRHLPRRLAVAATSFLVIFGGLALLAGWPAFTAAFGFPGDSGAAPALVLGAILGAPVLFWLTPLSHAMSRRHEFEADAYARHLLGSPGPLVAALRTLTERNLANLTPHPAYSRWYYSHPTFTERVAALEKDATPAVAPAT